jgi:hypothetical protein
MSRHSSFSYLAPWPFKFRVVFSVFPMRYAPLERSLRFSALLWEAPRFCTRLTFAGLDDYVVSSPLQNFTKWLQYQTLVDVVFRLFALAVEVCQGTLAFFDCDFERKIADSDTQQEVLKTDGRKCKAAGGDRRYLGNLGWRASV